MIRRSVVLSLLLALTPVMAPAQTVVGETQLHYLSIGDTELAELVFPLAASWRTSWMRLDVNTAWAQAEYEGEEGARSEISGLTDITVRVTVPLVRDRARLLVSGNIPTGTETLTSDQLPVAAALTTDLLALPVRSFGSGAGVTTGLAAAQPVGDWVLGGIAVYRVGSAYESVSGGAGVPGAEFRPGSELRMRLAAERPRVAGVSWRFGASWSRFQEDEADEEPIFARGDRVLGEAIAEFPFLRGAATVYSWGLYRSDSRIEAEPEPQEVPASTLLGVGGVMRYPVSRNLTLRPRLEFTAQRGETGPGGGDGWLARVGSGAAYRLGSLVIEPAALLQVGDVTGDEALGFVFRAGVLWGD